MRGGGVEEDEDGLLEEGPGAGADQHHDQQRQRGVQVVLGQHIELHLHIYTALIYIKHIFPGYAFEDIIFLHVRSSNIYINHFSLIKSVRIVSSSLSHQCGASLHGLLQISTTEQNSDFATFLVAVRTS